jgi:hypothetical protein
MNEWIKQWGTPGAILAGLGLIATILIFRFGAVDAQYADVSKRLTEMDAKIDRRSDVLGGRFDAILQQQTNMAAQLGAVQGELAYIKLRLDRVADKLQVTAVEPSLRSPAAVRPDDGLTPSAPAQARDPSQFGTMPAQSPNFAR